MQPLPIFLSVVLVVRNQAPEIEALLLEATRALSGLVDEYELIIVDNASDDDSLAQLKRLTREDGLPNLQIYALTKEVGFDTASWAGVESALGDYVCVIDPLADDIAFLPAMLDSAQRGADVVFAANEKRPPVTWAYRMAAAAFNALYKGFSGVDLRREAPAYRVLSKRLINFIERHPQPSLAYRHLPATGGFSRVNLTYSARPKRSRPRRLGDSIERGMQILLTTTHIPMRLVTSLAAFGAISNLFYSAYVVAIAIFKDDVAPGWVTLSLQQSGMFFLISLVLLVLGEYILHMASLSNEGPRFHVAQEFTSAVMTRQKRLNVEGNPVLRANRRDEPVRS
jgi:polyisoprenyl-phosphate glycosyltransferase